MSGLSLKKADREAARKTKQQRKQEKRNKRKHAATVDKGMTEPWRDGLLAVAESRRREAGD
jgi:hypothetical protein